MATKKKKKPTFKRTKLNIKKLWKKAQQAVADTPDLFGGPPDGRYICKLTAGEIKVSAEKSWKHIEWIWSVLEGDNAGEDIFNRSGIETEENLTYLIRDFARLDIDTESLEINSEQDIADTVQQLVDEGIVARLRVKTGDSGYTNVYIDKLIDDYSGSEVAKVGTDGFDVGDRITTEFDDEPYAGKITAIDGDTATIKFDDGEASDVALDELTAEDGGGKDELAAGDRVTTEIDGKTYAGKIKSIDNDEATIKFDDGDTDTYPIDEVTVLEATATGDDLVGKTMGFPKGKKMFVGEIISVDTNAGTFVMKTDTDKKVKGDIDNLEEQEPTPSWDVGDRVTTEIDGKTYAGVIDDIDGNNATVTFDDGEELTVALDELTEEKE